MLCQRQLKAFLLISEYAGIPIEASKTIEPSTCVPIHGILVEEVLMQVRLP